MVLVDTTVWIDFFSNRPEPHVAAVRRLIENGEDLCLCGLVLAEILQGIRSDTAYGKTKDYLSALIPSYELPTTPHCWAAAVAGARPARLTRRRASVMMEGEWSVGPTKLPPIPSLN